MCKLKNTIIAVFVIIPMILCAVVTVKPTGQGGDYDSIQDAIDDIVLEVINDDEIHIYPSSGDYWEEDIFFANIDLKMKGIGDVSLKNSTADNGATFRFIATENCELTLENLNIENDEDDYAVYVTGPNTGYLYEPVVELVDCTFGSTSLADGLVYMSRTQSIVINECEFRGTGTSSTSLNCVDTREISLNNSIFNGPSQTAVKARIPAISGTEWFSEIKKNKITGSAFPLNIYCLYNVDMDICRNLIYDIKEDNFDYTFKICEGTASTGNSIHFYNNTIRCIESKDVFWDPDTGYDYVEMDIINNIFYTFDDFIEDGAAIPTEFNIDNNCCNLTLNDSANGDIDNITDNPQFESSSSYLLKYYSPCINTGSDNSDYDDPDESRADMGYNYHEHDVYKWVASASTRTYIWKCFPKLPLDHSSYTINDGDAIDVDEVWENWRPYTTGLNSWYVDAVAATGSYGNNIWTWTPSAYEIDSTRGYKLQRTGTGYPKMFSRGLLCKSNVELHTTAASVDWLGYFLPATQKVLEAFPSTVTDDAIKIWTQDWCISRNTTSDPWTGSPNSCYLHYMDAVLITTLNNNHTFTWQSPSREDETGYRPVAEHFIFVDEIDYQPLYVYFAENDLPQEVAVYVNNVCKGAQVVEDTICQICAYILEEEAGEEIEFVFYYNERSEIQRCCKYSVYDRNTNRFESQSLLTGTPGIHYEVRFDQHKQDIPGIEDNLYCYPNPFNPELSICFNIKNTEHIKLEVYNTKGQMVKSLIAETCRPGDYHVIWKGDNNSGNKVCSGIYYIRLQTGDKVETSKALLLK